MIVSNIFSQSEKQFHPLSELQFGVDDHVALFLPFWQFVFVALFVEVLADLGVVFEVFLEEDDSFGLGDFVGLQERENADQDIGPRCEVALILLDLCGEIVVGASYSLHFCLFHDPLPIHL